MIDKLSYTHNQSSSSSPRPIIISSRNALCTRAYAILIPAQRHATSSSPRLCFFHRRAASRSSREIAPPRHIGFPRFSTIIRIYRAERQDLAFVTPIYRNESGTCSKRIRGYLVTSRWVAFLKIGGFVELVLTVPAFLLPHESEAFQSVAGVRLAFRKIDRSFSLSLSPSPCTVPCCSVAARCVSREIAKGGNGRDKWRVSGGYLESAVGSLSLSLFSLPSSSFSLSLSPPLPLPLPLSLATVSS